MLVTGASGYVGGRLVAALAGQPGIGVRALTRKPTAFPAGVQVMQADLLGPPETLLAACQGVDAIVHLAGPNEVHAAADPDGTLAATVAGTRRVALAAAESGVRRLVYVSTVHVYGAALTEDALINEERLPAPRHPYALARLAAEFAAASQPGLDLVVLRLTNSVGAPSQPDVDRWTLVANDLCRQVALTGVLRLATSGVQWRDFVALADVCRIVAGCLEPASPPAGTYNLGAGVSMTIRQLAGLVQDAYEARGQPRPPLLAPDATGPDPKPYQVSVAKLAAYGYGPVVPLAEAVDETLAFCLDHRAEL